MYDIHMLSHFLLNTNEPAFRSSLPSLSHSHLSLLNPSLLRSSGTTPEQLMHMLFFFNTLSNSSTDYDSDGCQDSGEDIDDDNDSASNVVTLIIC